MCYYWNCWFHVIYLFHMIYIFLCYHIHFTWYHSLRSLRFPFSCCSIGTSLGVTLGGLQVFLHYDFSIGTSLGTTLGGLSGYLVCICIILVGAYCFCCLVGYLCVTCARPWYVYSSASNYCPLFLFVDCCFDPLGMMSNNYARFLSAV